LLACLMRLSSERVAGSVCVQQVVGVQRKKAPQWAHYCQARPVRPDDGFLEPLVAAEGKLKFSASVWSAHSLLI
jgi:hypothetical protein